MNYQEYQQLFVDIQHNENPQYPYDDPQYRHYTKMNQARMSRWDKQLKPNEALATIISKINNVQHWIIITEPWCGDAAHTLPLMIGLAEINEKITYDIQLRDSEPFLINNYLTGTSKSIPKLIVRNERGDDLFNWGPRPQPAQALFNQLKAEGVDHDVITSALQQWYNQDKGASFNEEMMALFTLNQF
ncbi:thioredoxin-like protein [Mucilaginibacter yixingensis]|uniref:Thioredoxin-like protein n=1 Tax=Mucilaginibacter yixingensis TaxID=1295612 RepID=A0A2T5JAE9_9SPHI|nr:thioredoxin family protein [Mucilaginibacter yixingensis]PTQ97851.1 thioredoxin-like protein [Mucilaginibacter yixingensis]